MHWIFGVKFVNLGDSCTVGGDPAMNIIIARVPVLNVSDFFEHLVLAYTIEFMDDLGLVRYIICCRF